MRQFISLALSLLAFGATAFPVAAQSNQLAEDVREMAWSITDFVMSLGLKGAQERQR